LAFVHAIKSGDKKKRLEIKLLPGFLGCGCHKYEVICYERLRNGPRSPWANTTWGRSELTKDGKGSMSSTAEMRAYWGYQA